MNCIFHYSDCLPWLWLWLPPPCFYTSTQCNVQCTKWTFLQNISVLSSGLTVKTWWIKEVLLKAAPTITGSWWRRRWRGWRVEELHCDQHSHPFPLHPSPCPPIGHPWSAGQTLASYWWRMERGILENFASISTGGGEGAAGTWHWAATALNNTEQHWAPLSNTE